MRFAISGGGTAGHVNPAIACALELRERGNEVLFIGTPNGPEAHLAPQAGIEFRPLEASGYDRSKPLTLLTSSARILASALTAKKWFAHERFDAVVGFGGYVALPVGLAASWSNVPLVIHEQNSVPGLTNKTLAKHAQTVAVTYELSREYFPPACRSRIEVTGNPVRASVIAGDSSRGRERFDIPSNALFLLVFGGSLGAQHLNDALIGCKQSLMAIDNLYILHSTGAAKYDATVAALGEANPRWKVVRYIDEMGDALAASDFVISRAGATSLAEITALGVPSLLVPFPYATDDHQTKNAQDLARAGAAVVVADSSLGGPEFQTELMKILSSKPLRDTMALATKKLGRPEATENLAELVVRAARRG